MFISQATKVYHKNAVTRARAILIRTKPIRAAHGIHQQQRRQNARPSLITSGDRLRQPRTARSRSLSARSRARIPLADSTGLERERQGQILHGNHIRPDCCESAHLLPHARRAVPRRRVPVVAADGASGAAVALARGACGGGLDVGPDEVGCRRHELRAQRHPAQGEGFEGQAVGVAVVFGLAADFGDDFRVGVEEDFDYAAEDGVEWYHPLRVLGLSFRVSKELTRLREDATYVAVDIRQATDQDTVVVRVLPWIGVDTVSGNVATVHDLPRCRICLVN